MVKFNVHALVAAAAVSTVVSGAVTSARLTIAQVEPGDTQTMQEFMPREMPPPRMGDNFQPSADRWQSPQPQGDMRQWQMRPEMRGDRQNFPENNSTERRFPMPMHRAQEGTARSEVWGNTDDDIMRGRPMNGATNGTMNGSMNGASNGPWNAPMNGTMNGPMNGTMNGTMNGHNGMNGANGINGINGMNGMNGIHGLNGENGMNGINGMNGMNGINGINGLHESMSEPTTMPRSMPPIGNEMQQWRQMQGGLDQLLSDDDTDIDEAEAMIERMEEMLGKIDAKQAKLLEKKGKVKSAIARKLIDRKIKELDRVEGQIRDQLAEFEEMLEEDYEEGSEE
jgi:hypothetical protein